MPTKLCFVILLFLSLGTSIWAQKHQKPPYSLHSPTAVYRLPDYLEEVSGLTYYAPGQLAMHNDENGRMYVFDLEKRKVVQRVRFGGDGDFEGIERIGDHIYVIKSNGKLYRFHVGLEGVVEEISTPFHVGNNVEGLGYDAQKHLLLIALKDDGDVDKVKVKGKAIYGFDLKEEKFIKLPIYSVSHKQLEQVVGKDFKFHPSGIAIHPLTGEAYVLSAHKRALMVFGTDGKPKNLTELKRSLFPQPEGIAFAPNGDLFISNEVEGDGGTLLWFKLNNGN